MKRAEIGSILTAKIGEMSSKDPLDTLFSSVDALLDWVGEVPFYPKKSHGKSIDLANIPVTFDIETTSTYIGEGKKMEKVAWMYVWTMCINGGVIMGRTWSDFLFALSRIRERWKLSAEKLAVVYIRNLEFEFQFIRGWLEWESVFAISQRHPVYARTKDGFEFRCSYILSGEALVTSGKKLRRYPVKKLIGQLDYRKIRTCMTPLTNKELEYCINDVRVDAAYIKERMEEVDDKLTRVLLTKTSYVRKAVRDNCFYTGKSHKRGGWKREAYMQKMTHLTISGAEEYRMLKRAFQGGFTHVSSRFSGTLQRGVDSWDITSSYPASALANKFPMSSGEFVKITGPEDFRRTISIYACVFDAEFNGLCIKPEAPDCPLSASKCWGSSGVVENNGRVAEAETVKTTITDVDFRIYEQFYTWKSMRIGRFIRYRKSYLPREIFESILDFYEKKTRLKNVEGKEQEYNQAKENNNSIYGCMVTDICREEQEYDGKQWINPKMPDIEETLRKYNEDKRRFLFYPWGVFITAYSRERLFNAIWACGERHYYYSDTDSCKIVKGDEIRVYFEDANKRFEVKLNKALRYHRIDPARAAPCTIEGIKKPLGAWDYEGQYDRFKAIRAKAYMWEKIRNGDPELNITVAGVNKFVAVPYLRKKYKDPFEAFNDGLTIPAEWSGKLTHTYLDREQKGEIVDYRGIIGPYDEKSSIHMEGASYEMSLSLQYIDYIKGVQQTWKHSI